MKIYIHSHFDKELKPMSMAAWCPILQTSFYAEILENEPKDPDDRFPFRKMPQVISPAAKNPYQIFITKSYLSTAENNFFAWITNHRTSAQGENRNFDWVILHSTEPIHLNLEDSALIDKTFRSYDHFFKNAKVGENESIEILYDQNYDENSIKLLRNFTKATIGV